MDASRSAPERHAVPHARLVLFFALTRILSLPGTPQSQFNEESAFVIEEVPPHYDAEVRLRTRAGEAQTRGAQMYKRVAMLRALPLLTPTCELVSVQVGLSLVAKLQSIVRELRERPCEA